MKSGERGRFGLFQIYTGEGKGKSTASIGLAVRALGAGLRVYYLALLKGGDWKTGEGALLPGLHPAFTYRAVGSATRTRRGGDVEQAQPADLRARLGAEMEVLRDVVAGGEYDLVICDEMCVCVARGLIPADVALGIVRARARGVEIVYTGRGAPPELMEIADLITEMRKVRHPYDRGVRARRGIEF